MNGSPVFLWSCDRLYKEFTANNNPGVTANFTQMGSPFTIQLSATQPYRNRIIEKIEKNKWK